MVISEVYEIQITVSLMIIFSIIAVAIALSFIRSRTGSLMVERLNLVGFLLILPIHDI